MTATASSRLDDVEPCAHETRDRIITGIITAVPFLCLGLVGWQLWARLLGWSDLAVFGIMYIVTGLGVTVGFHRLFTHRAFKTTRTLRAVFAVLGSAAIEGPVISWVADHRKHHAFSDRPGDPHSPHVDHGVGWRGAAKGLLHAHIGWLFRHHLPDVRAARPGTLADRPVGARDPRPGGVRAGLGRGARQPGASSAQGRAGRRMTWAVGRTFVLGAHGRSAASRGSSRLAPRPSSPASCCSSSPT